MRGRPAAARRGLTAFWEQAALRGPTRAPSRQATNFSIILELDRGPDLAREHRPYAET